MSKYRVLISDCIIRNENGIQINSKEFMLYYYLKILHDKQRSLTVNINCHKYMYKYGIKSNPTFKKMLDSLYNSGLINTQIDSMSKDGMVRVELNKEYVKKKPFTMIHINLYYMIKDIGHEGLRLMYYYESRINRCKDESLIGKCSYAGIRTIAKETKLNKNKVIEYNEKLIKLKLLKVERNELTWTNTYDEFDQEIKTKYTNKYHPLIYNVQGKSKGGKVDTKT